MSGVSVVVCLLCNHKKEALKEQNKPQTGDELQPSKLVCFDDLHVDFTIIWPHLICCLKSQRKRYGC